MPLNKKSPIARKKRSLHSASGFGKPTKRPFPEQNKQVGEDAMRGLMKSLKKLNDATRRQGNDG